MRGPAVAGGNRNGCQQAWAGPAWLPLPGRESELPCWLGGHEGKETRSIPPAKPSLFSSQDVVLSRGHGASTSIFLRREAPWLPRHLTVHLREG